jgi:hypothetical protein
MAPLAHHPDLFGGGPDILGIFGLYMNRTWTVADLTAHVFEIRGLLFIDETARLSVTRGMTPVASFHLRLCEVITHLLDSFEGMGFLRKLPIVLVFFFVAFGTAAGPNVGPFLGPHKGSKDQKGE